MITSMPLAVRRRRRLVGRFYLFEVRRLVRSPRFLLFTLAFPVVFYLVSYSNPTNNSSAEHWAGTTWAIYFMVSMCAWAAIAAAFNASGSRLAAERASGWNRQLRLTPLPSWAYTAGKVLTGVTLALGGALVVALVAAVADHPHLSPGTWATVVAASWLGGLPFAALGILLGLVTSSSSAQAVVITTLLTLYLLGGLVVPLQAFPQWLRDVAKVLPTYHLADIGWRAVAGQSFDPINVVVLAAYTIAFGGLAAWRYREPTRRD